MSCSRCDTFAECTGCNIEDDDKVIQFKPGDHITISFQEISPELLEEVFVKHSCFRITSLKSLVHNKIRSYMVKKLHLVTCLLITYSFRCRITLKIQLANERIKCKSLKACLTSSVYMALSIL